MGLILAQLDGLQAGVSDWAKQQGKKVRNPFNKVCQRHQIEMFNMFFSPQPLSQFNIQFLNAVGDLLDLIPALVPGDKSTLNQYKTPPMGHCSALIKVETHITHFSEFHQ